MEINQQHFEPKPNVMGKIFRAGMIVYSVEDDYTSLLKSCRMMFMLPSNTTYSGNYFQIPKGRIEDGETAKECALREAKEEVGLFIGNIISGPHEVGVFMGRTTIFVCKVRPDALFGEPSDETSDTRWMTLDEFEDEGRPLHVPVIQAVYRFIEKLEHENRENK